ncbi:MAG: pyridoxamine 5'-phosphate oxidase family protein [Acidimicrobiales bacterium]
MAVVDSRTWMEHLSPKECWELLATSPVGRIGVLIDSAPEVYPVNHRVDGETIVFRTDPGGKLHGLHRSPSVCFEVDGFDPVTHDGWSVLVKGRATEVVAAEDLRVATAEPLEHWGLGPKGHWIRIVPAEVTGRRIHPHTKSPNEPERTNR